MSSIPLIQSQMRASALTIMATRSQDQSLVADVAASKFHRVKSRQDLRRETRDRASGSGAVVVPSFGWHPWFSHQIQDDLSPEAGNTTTTSTGQTTQDKEEGEETAASSAKEAHYLSVLHPRPDSSFISSLPPPIPLSSLLKLLSGNLHSFPNALVGEIGLDKAFRLPSSHSGPIIPPGRPASSSSSSNLTPGGREGRPLSPYRVKPAHQRRILEAQLRLAGEERRAVSVHGVQAHGLLLETVAQCWKGHERKVKSRRERRLVAEGAESDSDDDGGGSGGITLNATGPPLAYPPRICLHSFSAGSEVLRQWLSPTVPSRIYFSFSIAVNASTETAREKLRDVIKEVPDDKVLVESDLHVAGPEMDRALEHMYRFVCEVKGWSLEQGVTQIAKNFTSFIFA